MAENLKHLFSQGLGYGKGKPLPEPDVVIADYAPFECALAASRARLNTSTQEAVANKPGSLDPAVLAEIERKDITRGMSQREKNELFRSMYGDSRENLEAVLAQNYDSKGVAFEQSYRYPGKAVPVLLTVIAAVVILILIVAGV